MTDKYWKKVYTTNGLLEADTIRLFLESFNIASFVSQESAGTTFGFTVGRLGQAQILVKNEDFEQAQLVLNQLEDGIFNVADENIISGSSVGDLGVEDLDL